MSRMVTSVVLELVDRVTRPVRGVQQSLAGLSRRAGLDRLAARGRAVATATRGMVTEFTSLTKRLAMVGGAAAGAVWGLRRLVGGFTGPADEAIKLSRRISMTFEELQLLSGAADRMSNMGDGELGSNLEAFTYRLGQAAAGMGESAKAMAWAGIDMRDGEGNMRSSMDVLMDIADKMASIDSEEMQARFARAMFGRSGTSMIDMLREGREGIQAEMDAWARTGQLISEEDAVDAETYNTILGELDGTIKGLRNAVVIGLVPALTEWLETITPLIQANREMITGEVLRRMGDFWRALQTAAGVVGWVADRVGGLGNLLAILAVLMAGRFLLSAFMAARALGLFGWEALKIAVRFAPMLAAGLMGAVRWFIALAARAIPAAIAGIRALSVALLTTPIGWVITGAAALAGVVYLIYRHWGTVGPWFRSLWEGIKDWFSQGIGGITRDLLSWSPAGILLRAVDAVFEMFGMRPLSEVVGEWVSGVGERIEQLWADIRAWFGRGIGAVTADLLSFHPAALLMRGIDAVFELFGMRPLTEVGKEWIGGLWSGISERWGQLTSWLSESIEGLTSWMPDWARDRLGLSDLGAAPDAGPEAALGAPVAQQGVREAMRESRTEVGGELHIRIDSEGRPRVQNARQRGPMGFDVDAGMLGVMP